MTDSPLGGDTDPVGLWVPVSELAQMRGVARQVMYRKVDRLVEQGALAVRLGARGVKLISPAQYDRALGLVADLAREQGARTAAGEDAEPEPDDSAGATYTREQARNMAYRADISQMERDEKRGELVKAAKLRPVIEAAGRAVAAAIEGFSENLDALRAAALDEDHTVFNRAVRDEIRRVRADVVKAVQGAMPSARQPGEGAPSAE